jgi:hypothetical protein
MVDVKLSHTDAWSYDASRKVVRVPFWTDGQRREAFVTLEFLTDRLGASENANSLDFAKRHEPRSTTSSATGRRWGPALRARRHPAYHKRRSAVKAAPHPTIIKTSAHLPI